jgi:NADPH:quinone reductase-like Zn-dependent oxidoreductase
MRAMAIDDYGTTPTLHDLAIPEPGQGEVRVRVQAASLNGFDLAVVSGAVKQYMEYRFPVVPGRDFAGVVDAVGPGVSTVAVGDEVFGVVTKPALGDGSFGELVTVSAANLTRIPSGVDATSAAAAGLAATTALEAIDAIASSAGDAVFISGATGGVGHFAIQLASARGAHVIATARPGDEERFVRELGAADTVDYTGDVAETVAALRSEGVRAALHLAGDGLALTTILVPGGRLVSTLGIGPEQVADRDVQAVAVMAAPTTAMLERLADELAAGRLVARVQRTYKLEDVPQALEDFANGKLGKLVVLID